MDLKPQNILLSSEYNPCLKLAGDTNLQICLHKQSSFLIDFGMAQHLDTGDHADSFRGSPLYMVGIVYSYMSVVKCEVDL